ncbi:MAG: methyltransferase domain-containing protein, partial [Bdellovibrionales bacterium]|nr:methyltransferase domain-containing protein [Bdellovibrionales bacterium]
MGSKSKLAQATLLDSGMADSRNGNSRGTVPQNGGEHALSSDGESTTEKTSSDRVSELYAGKIFTKETQRSCRDRIHWICEQVQGNRVLDLGCSQGITGIILAKRGYEVVGVDINEHAIAYANHDRDTLPQEARERLTYIHSDLFTLSPEVVGTFDTVILGEVIEHFFEPIRIIQRAAQFLNPGGTCIITTPFGVKPNEDHHSTFTPRSLGMLVSGSFVVDNYSVRDSFLRIVGTLPASAEILLQQPNLTRDHLLELTEKGLLESQSELFTVIQRKNEAIAQRQIRCERAEEELRNLQGERERLVSTISTLKSEIQALQKTQNAAGRQRAQLMKELESLRATTREKTESLRTCASRDKEAAKIAMHREVLAKLKAARELESVSAELSFIRQSISFRFAEKVRSVRSAKGLLTLPFVLTPLVFERIVGRGKVPFLLNGKKTPSPQELESTLFLHCSDKGVSSLDGFANKL